MAQESWKLDKEETSCQPPEGPINCVNNCGFFGSKATMNMCSKCYKDLVLVKAKSTSEKAAVENLSASIMPSRVVLDVAQAQAHLEASVDSPASNLDKLVGQSIISVNVSQEASPSCPRNRCFSCNKRVGLTGFKCRCGDTFCSLHRYSDKHKCSFDYKTAGRDAIAKANPLVKADKVEKI